MVPKSLQLSAQGVNFGFPLPNQAFKGELTRKNVLGKQHLRFLEAHRFEPVEPLRLGQLISGRTRSVPRSRPDVSGKDVYVC